MFLRAPPDSQPFRGDALRTWALAHGVVGYNPNGTLTDRPGAGFNPQWMNTRPYNVPGFIPLWPSMPAMPTSFLPMHRDAAPLWRGFYGMCGMGAITDGLSVPAIIGQALPILEREVEAAATRAVKNVFRDYVMPPLVGVAALAGIAIIVAISAYRKKNASRRRNRRRSRSGR